MSKMRFDNMLEMIFIYVEEMREEFEISYVRHITGF